jgi:XTP/dITP diphosphohydrolase
LSGLPYEIVSKKGTAAEHFEPDENGDTFEENAKIKAVEIRDITGEAAISDDSGLVADALGGDPGVHSSRYSESGQDADNLAKLMRLMENVPEEERTARFVCAACYAEPGKDPIIVRGTCEGTIAKEAKGTAGFGYDPVFIPKENNPQNLTFSEMTAEQKNKISHRKKAFEALLPSLRAQRSNPVLNS